MTPTQRKAAERLMEQMGNDHRGYDPDFNEAAAILRELLAEPVQEPVAYIDQRQLAAGYVTLLCITRPEYRSYADVAEGIHYTPVYLHPSRQPMRCPTDGGECGAGGYCRPEPQQHKPLSDEQVRQIVVEASTSWAFKRDGSTSMRIARAVERSHGIGEPT